MAARRKPTAAEAEATEVPDVVEVPETEPDVVEVEDVETPEDVEAATPDTDGDQGAPAVESNGDRVLLDPEGNAHTIVAAGVQALLNLGWTNAD